MSEPSEPPPFAVSQESAEYDPDLAAELEGATQRHFEEFAEEALATLGQAGNRPEYEVRTVPDLAARTVLDAAKGAQLLVVGTNGRGVFNRLLLGSVSRQCVHHADGPIVVVPRPEDG